MQVATGSLQLFAAEGAARPYRFEAPRTMRFQRRGSPDYESNVCSMPNASAESPLLRATKILVSILQASERARLRPWIMATYAIDGSEARRFHDRAEDE
jgi:hypothetical protein